MTQAVSLKEILKKNGHEIVSVMAGKSERRVIPDFFYQKAGVPVTTFESPNFTVDSDNKSILVWPSIICNLKKTRRFLRSLKKIHGEVKEKQPDVIINFYDLMGGLYNFFYRPKASFVGVAHQFLAYHPDFQFPEKRRVDRYLYKLHNDLSSLGADKTLALSFLPVKKSNKITIVPPLLRSEVLEKRCCEEDFFLVYLLNAGYAEEIKQWHQEHTEVRLHCFWDRKDAPGELKVHENLVFHKINDIKFLDYMSRCKGLISSAGFESVCEAMYMDKPVMMVPTGGHLEQECNAMDAVKAGAGIKNTQFNLSDFLEYLPTHKHDHSGFREWVKSAEKKFVEALSCHEKIN